MQIHEIEQTQEKVQNKMNIITLVVMLLMISVLSFFLYINRSDVLEIKKQMDILKKDNVDLNKKLEGITQEALKSSLNEPPNDTPLMAYRPVLYQGVIKKEEIPEEYALGDYWYILYFDVAQEVETVAGKRQLEKIEVTTNGADIPIDNFLDKEVVIDGRLSTGFAESTIVIIEDIIEK